MKRRRWEPRGGYAPSKYLTPRDGRRVHGVMKYYRGIGGRWLGTGDVITAVHRYEQKKGYSTIGEPRMRRALHWLVAQGYAGVEERKPFTKRTDRHVTVYVLNKELPASVPSHKPRIRRKKRGSTSR